MWACGTSYTGVRVGTVEAFQGMERAAIILSCVRASFAHVRLDLKYKLGFVGNPKCGTL